MARKFYRYVIVAALLVLAVGFWNHQIAHTRSTG
jgi:hypothetical protein